MGASGLGSNHNGQEESARSRMMPKHLCPRCGARRIDQQIGLEETPEAYVAKLVDVFREVRRVLHPSGTVWLNLGDSYAGGGGFSPSAPSNQHSRAGHRGAEVLGVGLGIKPGNGIKAKDLVGIPWMVAFALRADGWWLRSAITWCKGNPMPESVTDRCTSATEMVFMFAKSERYFYDSIAIAEPAINAGKTVHTNGNEGMDKGYDGHRTRDGFKRGVVVGETRNRRNWWAINSEPYPQSHFATMPTKLVEPCILAGTSAKGCCAKCGSPYERVVERTNESNCDERKQNGADSGSLANGHNASHGRGVTHNLPSRETLTLDWQPTCSCNAAVVPCVTLDPFCGSGTVGVVALRHHRDFIGIDLNSDYLELSEKRLNQSQPILEGLFV